MQQIVQVDRPYRTNSPGVVVTGGIAGDIVETSTPKGNVVTLDHTELRQAVRSQQIPQAPLPYVRPVKRGRGRPRKDAVSE